MWWRLRDLNPGPMDYDSTALTTELSRRRISIIAWCKPNINPARVRSRQLRSKFKVNLLRRNVICAFFSATGRGAAAGAALFAASPARAFTFWLTSKSMSDWPELKRRIREKFPNAPVLTTAALAAWRADAARKPPVLFDVRTPAEYAVSHLRGARHHEKVEAIAQAIAALPRDTAVVVYCSVGYRSGEVVERLMNRASSASDLRIFNLEGSLFEWANSGRELVQTTKDGAQVVQVAHSFNKNWAGLLEKRLWVNKDGANP
jgi:rhodanese-related sulfurtransferase